MTLAAPPDRDPGDELLKASQVAEMMKMAERTLADWRWRGTGPPFTKLSAGRGGRIRYRRSDVEAWIARGSNSGGMGGDAA